MLFELSCGSLEDVLFDKIDPFTYSLFLFFWYIYRKLIVCVVCNVQVPRDGEPQQQFGCRHAKRDPVHQGFAGTEPGGDHRHQHQL